MQKKRCHRRQRFFAKLKIKESRLVSHGYDGESRRYWLDDHEHQGCQDGNAQGEVREASLFFMFIQAEQADADGRADSSEQGAQREILVHGIRRQQADDHGPVDDDGIALGQHRFGIAAHRRKPIGPVDTAQAGEERRCVEHLIPPGRPLAAVSRPPHDEGVNQDGHAADDVVVIFRDELDDSCTDSHQDSGDDDHLADFPFRRPRLGIHFLINLGKDFHEEGKDEKDDANERIERSQGDGNQNRDGQAHAGEKGETLDLHDMELRVHRKIRKDIKHQHSGNTFDRLGPHVQEHEEDAHAHIDTRKTGEHRPHQASHEERRYGR